MLSSKETFQGNINLIGAKSQMLLDRIYLWMGYGVLKGPVPNCESLFFLLPHEAGAIETFKGSSPKVI